MGLISLRGIIEGSIVIPVKPYIQLCIGAGVIKYVYGESRGLTQFKGCTAWVESILIGTIAICISSWLSIRFSIYYTADVNLRDIRYTVACSVTSSSSRIWWVLKVAIIHAINRNRCGIAVGTTVAIRISVGYGYCTGARYSWIKVEGFAITIIRYACAGVFATSWHAATEGLPAIFQAKVCDWAESHRRQGKDLNTYRLAGFAAVAIREGVGHIVGTRARCAHIEHCCTRCIIRRKAC